LKDKAKRFDRVDMPGKHDILVGKGTPFQRHVGNVWLRTIVESYMDQYISAPKGEKQNVIRIMRNLVRNDGGRFLKKERDDWWTEVSEADALDKITKLVQSVKASAKGTNRGLAISKCISSQAEGKKRARIGFCQDCCPSPEMASANM
jgi:hypothetical protein